MIPLVLCLLVLAGCASAGTAAPGPAGTADPAPIARPSVPVTAAPAADDRVAPPAGVRLAGIDVEAPVIDVGVDDRGEMEVPEDVSTVGWYRFGPSPGSDTGSAVLSGHVDDRVQGRGAFYELAESAVGDPVEVDLADGSVARYRVVRVERIDKSVLPVDRLFARAGSPVLTLVTCGGEFDRETRNYRENVVVTAEPVGG